MDEPILLPTSVIGSFASTIQCPSVWDLNKADRVL